jgi:hypothetical protein
VRDGPETRHAPRATGHGAWIHEPTASITEHPCQGRPLAEATRKY